MDSPRFTSNLDAVETTTTLDAIVEDAAVSKARAQLYTTATGLAAVVLVVAIIVAPAVVVAAYRWAF